MYVLQRINHEVFERPHDLMNNIVKALSYLKSDDYMGLNVILSKDGIHYVRNSTGYWRLMEFITDSVTYNITQQSVVSFEAGAVIGKFHNHLKNADPAEFSITIPNFHSLELRKKNFKEALLSGNQARIQQAQKAVSIAKRLLHQLEHARDIELKLRICHNDTKLNNILFSRSPRKGLCLIDLDTIMPGYFYYDFGDAVRTIVNSAPEDERDHSKITFRRDLFEDFIDGLRSSKLLLQPNECASLPFGAIYMPFIHGLRALTDYLENDRYYKVDYETQNFDRCLSLFDFAEKADREKAFMKDVILSKLN